MPFDFYLILIFVTLFNRLLEYFDAIFVGGSVISLTYVASEKVIPGYGGGMSSAKAALESDTRVLAFEVIIIYLFLCIVSLRYTK